MCELFGISSDYPVTASQELDKFRLRGGQVADNPDVGASPGGKTTRSIFPRSRSRRIRALCLHNYAGPRART